MPRERDVFATIEMQARHVIGLIEEEMAELETRLAKLRDQHVRWTEVLGGAPAPREARRRASAPAAAARAAAGRRSPTARAARGGSPPIDWDAVLKGLPARFTMSAVEAATPELADYPRARIVALARWSRAKLVKKIDAGLYEKVVPRARKRAQPAEPPAEPAAVAIEARDEGGDGLPPRDDPEITPAA